MERLSLAGPTEVVMGSGLPKDLLPHRDDRARVAILTQPAPTPLALGIASSLQAGGLSCEVIGLPDREEAKTLEVAASVYEALGRFGLGRHDTIMGVGGGSVTDLAGYVAGTWLRGVEVVHVPTTLLGAVDAAVGGKTGVNFGAKNLVGVIWHPSRVVIDIDQLATLPGFLTREGMAEAYKTALVGDGELADLIRAEGLEAPLEEIIPRSLRVKTTFVYQDVREKGVRAFLNLGHTIGHSIEIASRLSHGESIGLGIVAAAAISEKLVDFESAGEVKATIEMLGLPVRVDGLELARVLDLLEHDKKRDAGGLRMVLLEAIEKPILAHVDQVDVEFGLAAIGF